MIARQWRQPSALLMALMGCFDNQRSQVGDVGVAEAMGGEWHAPPKRGLSRLPAPDDEPEVRHPAGPAPL